MNFLVEQVLEKEQQKDTEQKQTADSVVVRRAAVQHSYATYLSILATFISFCPKSLKRVLVLHDLSQTIVRFPAYS